MKLKSKHIILRTCFIFSAIFFLCHGVLQAQVTANFTASSTNGCAPILVKFTNQSIGNPVQWKWDLGNGTISYLENPSVTYFIPGTYSVKLIVQTNNLSDSVVKENYITVYASPVADFNAASNSGCVPLTTKFTDKSVSVDGSIAKWEWDLGDGNLSNDQHPGYTYASVGEYNVTLKVTNNFGCVSSVRKASYIKANGVAALFIPTDISTCTESIISLTNNSTGNGTIKYKWFLGNNDTSTQEKFSYKYAEGGNYTIRLIAENNFGCKDSVITNVQLAATVSANFSADKLAFCTASSPVNFAIDKKVTGNIYLWDFGDSTKAELPNVMHQYSDTGIYTVKLIVANVKGCIDSVIKENYIRIGKQQMQFANIPDSNCTGFTKKFIAAKFFNDKIVQYLWNFGDGTSSTLASPTYSFSRPGYYDISLVTVNDLGCVDTLSLKNGIRVDKPSIANFSSDLKETCGDAGVSFTDLSKGNITAWEWDFGDGDKELVQNPTHVFRDTGFMTLTLIINNGGCADTATIKHYIYVNPAVACFKVNVDCSNPFLRKISNCSKGADEFLWNFGDGTTSTLVTPEHVYKDTGIYEITLKAINYKTGCTQTKTKLTRVLDVSTTFYASDTVVCRNQQIKLSAENSANNVYRYIWDFGDGIKSSSNSQTVVHKYFNPGVYSVRLVTTDLINCRDTLNKLAYIKVTGPVANFAPAKGAANVNTPLAFINSSAGSAGHPIKTMLWNFGDGNIEELNGDPFSHTYTKPGLYYPSLKVTDNLGCNDSVVTPVPVAITSVDIKFDVAKSVVCPGSKVKFYGQPFSRFLQYDWFFGDGGTYNGLNPEYIYKQEGLYDVTLVITDEFGNKDSLTRKQFIKVIATAVDFAMTDSFRYCPPLNVKFISNSSNVASSVWDFGDGTFTTNKDPSHFYSLPGTYKAKLSVTGTGGCKQELEKNIIIKGPTGIIEYDSIKLCKPFTAVITAKSENAVSYIWDYNDGNTAENTDTIVMHIYKNAGNYQPKVILVDALGCKVPIESKKVIHIAAATANFTVIANPGCDSGIAFFNNLSVINNDGIKNYRWDFGDGTISNIKQPTHEYFEDGKYYPSLIIESLGGCKDTFSAALPLNISLVPKVSFISSANGCTPLTINTSVKVKEKDAATIKWYWSFGNGNTSVMKDPPAQTYNSAGKYTLQLIAKGINGCEKTINKIIEAFEIPVVKAISDSVICLGNSIRLNASGAQKYIWSPAAGLTTDSVSNPTATPDSTLTYIVKGTAVNGCSAFKTVTVNVKKPIKLRYNRQESLCKGQSKKLIAIGASVYTWFPAAGLNDISSATPTSKPDSSTLYRVIGTDEKNCFKDTGYIMVMVHGMPIANAGVDKTILAGEPVDLVPRLSKDVTETNWYPTSGIFRNNENGITVKPRATTEYTLEAKNAGGCLTRDKVQVFVICNGSNVFIPNTFSPNGDGANEIFYPRGNGLFKVKSMRIFGRWGEVVFQKENFNANDPANGWDGTFKGAKLSSDVYVYIAEIICSNNSVLTFKGNVALVR